MGSVSAESNLTDNCSDLNNYNTINEVNVNNNQILSENESSISEDSNNVENNDLIQCTNKNIGLSQKDSLNNLSNTNNYPNLSSSSGNFANLYNTIYGKSYINLYQDYKYDKYFLDDYNFEGEYQKGIPISWSITIDGNGHTIDASNSASIFKIGTFYGTMKHITVTFKNINFINSGVNEYGSILISLDSTVNFINCYFNNNNAGDYGGALTIINNDYDEYDYTNADKSYNYYPTVNINDCTFEDNYADVNGGAIYNTGTLNIVSTNFNSNSARVFGGAIYNFGKGMGVESSRFYENSAPGSSSINNINNYNIGSSINNCEFTYNNDYVDGHYYNTINNVAGLMVISNSKIFNNKAGGISNYGNGFGNSKITVSNCEITDNAGEAISNGNTYTGITSIANIEQCIITDNNGGISNSEGSYSENILTNTVNLHFNVIYGNKINIDNSETMSKTSRVYAQYNWWGNNKGATGIKGSTVNTNYPVILTLSPSAGSTIPNEYSIITAYLNKYSVNGNLVTLAKSIPSRTAFFSSTNNIGSFSSDTTSLLDSATVSYTGVKNHPTTINVKVDNQVLNLNVDIKTVKVLNTLSNLSLSNSNLIYPGNLTTLINTVSTNSYNTVYNGSVSFYVNNNYLGSSNVNNGVSEYSWTPNYPGTYTILAKYTGNNFYNPSEDTMTVTVNDYIISDKNSTNLIGDDFIGTYGNSGNFTVRLIDNESKPIVGQHIALKLSNTNGQSKTYWSSTDIKGYANLEINLYPGHYTVESSYSGSKVYTSSKDTNSITVQKESSNLNSTILSANTFKEPYSAGDNFTGCLKDYNNNPLIGQHIALKLSNTNGQSKTYWVTTDVNGEYQLAINLFKGEYTVHCSYEGNNKYQSSTAFNTISVL